MALAIFMIGCDPAFASSPQGKAGNNCLVRALKWFTTSKGAGSETLEKPKRPVEPANPVPPETIASIDLTRRPAAPRKPSAPAPSLKDSYDLSFTPEKSITKAGRSTSDNFSENHGTLSLRYTGEATASPHGGKLHAVEVKSEWNPDQSGTKEFDRGKMSWNAELFGEKAAHFVGFGKKSGSERWDPDAAALNGANKAINRFIPNDSDKIAINWYEAPENQVSKREYVTQFSFNLAIPKAAPGTTSLHDGNFHWAASALPPLWLRLKAAQGRAVLRFEQFIKKNKLHRFKNKSGVSFGELHDKMIEEVDGEIDRLTGRVMTNMNPSIGRAAHAGDEEYGIHAYNNLSFGRSPEEIIRNTMSYSEWPPELKQAVDAFIAHQGEVDPDFKLTLWDDPELLPYKNEKHYAAMTEMTRIMERRIKKLRENIEKAADQSPK